MTKKVYGASAAHVHVKQPAKKVAPAPAKPVLPVAVKEQVQPVAPAPAPKPEVPKTENTNVPKAESK